MKQLHDKLYLLFAGPTGVYVTAWCVTLILVALGIVGVVLLPAFTAVTILFVCIFVLFTWEAYYDDWIDNAHIGQTREVLGARATVIKLRITIGGTIALCGASLVLAALAGHEITPRFVMTAASFAALCIPLSFTSARMFRLMLDCLRVVLNLPFQIAMLYYGMTAGEDRLDEKHQNLNVLGRKLFGVVTGYPSNLTFWLNTDALLRTLPTER